MNKDSKWKDNLLKSGIPLEYEAKEFLDKKGCISHLEYKYLRKNKQNDLTEFSYDIDSSYIKPPHYVDLMIECKYRHESTKWLFIPEDYGGIDEIEYTSFFHPNDHFNTINKFRFRSSFPFAFAPLCSKGIEINTDGQNPKSISQAVSQLSYAMADKIVDHMYHQVDDVLSNHFGNSIFYSVPIILTTAKLFRLKDKTTISQIKNSKEIGSIANEEDALIIKSKPGIELETYNRSSMHQLINKYGRAKFEKKLNTFNKDLDFVISVIAEHDSPSCIAVIHHTEENIGLSKLFDYIDRVIKPDKEIFELIKQKQKKIEQTLKDLKKEKR